jgi:aerobic-type carbon monoxide dehydrogenase small subunit (CoxS/CutS family)
VTAQFRVPRSAFHVEFTLNGARVSVLVSACDRLLDVLRETLGLTGAKEGCGEGECGACTVWLDGLPVCSCLVPAYQTRGRRVDTVEGVDPARLTPYLESGATQCGACTPGVVMAAEWIRAHPELLATHGVRELMAGNLCRCTGYDGIVDGITRAIAQDGSGL